MLPFSPDSSASSLSNPPHVIYLTMFHSTILPYVALLIAAPIAIEAKCFKTGVNFGWSEPQRGVKFDCIDYWSNGTWAPGQKTERCSRDQSNLYEVVHTVMQLNNDRDEERTLDWEECIRLFSEIEDCRKGGKHVFEEEGWFVR